MVQKKIYPRLFFSNSYFNKVFSERIIQSKSKGLDKMSAKFFENIKEGQFEIIITKCLNKTFSFTPYLELLKLKSANKPPRTISIASIRDRLVLYVLKDVLTNKFPEAVNKKRPNRYIFEVKKYSKNVEENIHYIKLDIENFYDTIDREILYNILESRGLNQIFLDLIKKAIENPTIPPNTNKTLRSTFTKKRGIPQGLSISNILAQIYLLSLDEELKKRNFLYLRYVDDILILNKGEISTFRKENIKKSLTKLKLILNENKTSEGQLDDGVTFLSYKIFQSQISISESKVQVFIRRIAGKFTWYKNAEYNREKRENWLDDDIRFKEVFLEDINEMITGSISDKKNYGWLFYFSEITDKMLLFKLDKIISSFFTSLNSFENTSPTNLKRLVRTFYTIKHGTNKGYINNYNDYNTIRKKRKYLIYRGAIDPNTNKSDVEIEYIFERFKTKKLKDLEQDIGYNYIS